MRRACSALAALLLAPACLKPPQELRHHGPGPDAGLVDAGPADAGPADAGPGVSYSACERIGGYDRTLFTKADPVHGQCTLLALVQPATQQGWGISTPIADDWGVEGGATWVYDGGCDNRPPEVAFLVSGTGAVTANFSDAGHLESWNVHVVLHFADAGPEALDADDLQADSSCP